MAVVEVLLVLVLVVIYWVVVVVVYCSLVAAVCVGVGACVMVVGYYCLCCLFVAANLLHHPQWRHSTMVNGGGGVGVGVRWVGAFGLDEGVLGAPHHFWMVWVGVGAEKCALYINSKIRGMG